MKNILYIYIVYMCNFWGNKVTKPAIVRATMVSALLERGNIGVFLLPLNEF